jgi:hypothetical protein
MSEYVTLLGAEDVARAGHNISAAADTMRSAAGTMEEAVRQGKIHSDDFLDRFEGLVDRMQKIAMSMP